MNGILRRRPLASSQWPPPCVGRYISSAVKILQRLGMLPDRTIAILLATIGLVVGGIAALALGPAVAVLTEYHAPSPAQTPPSAPGKPRVPRVILVVLSGVSTADLAAPGDPWRFVQFRRRAAEGAFATAHAVQPTGDAPTWAALLTGAPPALSGA